MSLPETTEEPHFEKSSFRVRKKIFATVPPDGRHLNVHVDPAEARALIEENPSAFGEICFGKNVKTDWVQVNLAAADAAEVRELLEDAWRLKAPPRVLAAFDAEQSG
jgi:hypothetical protein